MSYEGLTFNSIDLLFNLRYIVLLQLLHIIHTKLNLWLPVNDAVSRMHKFKGDKCMFDKLQPGVVIHCSYTAFASTLFLQPWRNRQTLLWARYREPICRDDPISRWRLQLMY